MNNVQLINLPKIEDQRGNLTFIEGKNHIPFDIKRVYWIYDVPGGEIRGGHAYKKNEEFIVALSGSFDCVITDGINNKLFSLNRPYYGLYIPNKLWRHLENFSTNSLCLVLASEPYAEKDFVRSRTNFEKLSK